MIKGSSGDPPRFVIAGCLNRDFILPIAGPPQINMFGGNLTYAAVGLNVWGEAGGLLARVGQEDIAHRGNTILMAYIGDDWGAAPTLSEIRFDSHEAQPLFERLVDNIQLMLKNHYIHGDLSAYNILYWEGQCTIIDFPQLVDARKNGNALMLLERDVRRVCQYFARCGVKSSPGEIVDDLWRGYMSGD